MLRPACLAAIALGLALSGCSRAVRTGSPASQQSTLPALAAYATSRLIVTPTSHVRVDSLAWVQRLGGSRAAGRHLDSALAVALGERGLGRDWLYPADLQRSYDRNRSYAANPYGLATEPLRPSTFQAASRYGEPLASQLRTMIALLEAARLVMVPVELRFERVGASARGVLRAALLDPRFAEARWVGEMRGDTSSVPDRALASVAAAFADLFAAR